MKHLIDKYSHKNNWSAAFRFYFEGKTLGVLDIETTGLNPAQSRFILGGLLLVSGNDVTSHQFFVETLDEEEVVLKAFLEEVAKADFLLTYNGKHFDLPFIEARATFPHPPLPYNFDLYLILNKYSTLRKFLPNLKQKTVENFMGFWESRTDEISGGESVLLYNEYLATRDPALEKKILLHNRDDIFQLYRLLDVLGKCDLHQALYFMGFPAVFPSDFSTGLLVTDIKITRNELVIQGTQQGKPIDYHAFEGDGTPCTIQLSSKQASFHIRVPFIRYSKMALADLNALNIPAEAFEQYPGCGDGLLVLEDHGKPNYLETNHFVKVLIERMMTQWIIEK